MAFRISLTTSLVIALLLVSCAEEEPQRPFLLAEVPSDELRKVSEEIRLDTTVGIPEPLSREIPSPDGRMIAVVDRDGGGGVPGRITVHDVGDATVTVIDTVDNCYDLVWAPDGSKLVYSDGPRVYIADADGTTRQMIHLAQKPSVAVAGYGFVWTDNGRRLSFVQVENIGGDTARNSMVVTITLDRARIEEDGEE